MTLSDRLIVLLISLSLLVPALSTAEVIESGPIVLTASGVEEPLQSVSSSIEVVTGDDIAEKQSVKVDEAIRGVSGLRVQTYGGADPWASVMIRGMDWDQTLVLVDGVEINNPYDYTAAIGGIQTNSIDRIEVLKGSHSAIYGSEAIGGVVNIINRDAMLTGPETDISVKGGNYNTSGASLFHGGREKYLSYSIGYGSYDTEGSIYTGPFSGDTVTARIKYGINDRTWVQFNSFYWDYVKKDGTLCCEIDNDNNFRMTLPDRFVWKESDWVNAVQLTRFPTDSWDYRLQYSRYDFKAEQDLSGDSDLPFPLKIDSENTGSRDVFDLQGNFYPYQGDTFTVGLNYREERLSTFEFSNLDSMGTDAAKEQPDIDVFRESRAFYVQNLFNSGGFTLTAGARIDDGIGFGNEVIPRGSVAYGFASTGTKIKAGYGKGIRAPSLRQLFDPLAGNRDLKPERSDSYEAAIEQRLGRMTAEAAYFHIDLEEMIEWSNDPNVSPHYVNIGNAWTKGVEAGVRADGLLKGLDIGIDYTYMETRDKESDEPLRFRPMNRLGVDIRYSGIDRLIFALDSEIVWPSYDPYTFLLDVNGDPFPGKTPSYKVINLAVSYDMPHPSLKGLKLEAKVNNLLNEEYEEIPGFRSLGTNLLAGVRARF